LLEELPARFTASDRLADFPNERSRELIASFRAGGAPVIERAFPKLGPVARTDELDGLRIHFASGDIVHVRASGNAPELRCYVEASSEARAETLLAGALAKLASLGGR
jgi:phosphomannomutase